MEERSSPTVEQSPTQKYNKYKVRQSDSSESSFCSSNWHQDTAMDKILNKEFQGIIFQWILKRHRKIIQWNKGENIHYEWKVE